jgi:hypothetical protein
MSYLRRFWIAKNDCEYETVYSRLYDKDIVSLMILRRQTHSSGPDVEEFVDSLLNRGLIRPVGPEGAGLYTRVTQDDSDLQVVRQMPTIASTAQPTIAIITANYCEKLAVDAMIENKQTYVRYNTVGALQKSVQKGSFSTVDYRCEDGCSPVSASCVTLSNPDSLSGSQAAGNPRRSGLNTVSLSLKKSSNSLYLFYIMKSWESTTRFRI